MQRSAQIQHLFVYRYRYVIGYSVLIALGLYMTLYKLGGLLPGIHNDEAISALNNASLSKIIENPINFPYKLVQWSLISVFGPKILILRIPSVIFGLLAVFLLYHLLRTWYWPRVAILGSLLFVTSSWFLHFARFANPAILVAPTVLGFFLTLSRFRLTKKFYWIFLAAIFFVIGMYTPYFLYFAAASILVNLWAIKTTLRQSKAWIMPVLIIIVILALAPLGYAIYIKPPVAKELLGIPDNFIGIKALLVNYWGTIAHIFWTSRENWGYHLGTLPMFDIFTASMVGLGLYHYERHWPSIRSKTLFIALPVITLAVSLKALPTSFVILIPLFYILATSGASTLLGQWYGIFPKNPIARTVGIIPFALLLATVFYYHHQRYFVAWPQTPEVRQEFHEDYPKLMEIFEQTNSKILVVGSESQIPRYQLAGLEFKNVSVSSTINQTSLKNYDIVYLSSSAQKEINASEMLNDHNVDYIPSNEPTSDSMLFIRYTKK
ncbi:hypothetical protein DYH10_02785 [Candidatus Saccharibacteria bacterium CPR2]|nr:hypothetical protein [Candidatus Saccharibacteria bacterium CPR2]